MRFDAGTPVRCEMAKWGDRPHWAYPGTYLGADEHGEWIGFPAGTRYTRPGKEFTGLNDQVGLVPAGVHGWLATFHAPGGEPWPVLGDSPVEVYVDMTTPATWDGDVLRATDLDLDVVRGRSGRVWVDDEDEFAEHRVAFDYPAEIVDLAVRTCTEIERAVRERTPPFDGCSDRWLAQVSSA